MSDYHVSNFPPESYRDATLVSEGWDGEVNLVRVEESGETFRVDHSEQETDTEQSEE